MSDNFDLEKGGVKFDAGKVRMDLVPQDAMMACACVFTYGAIKYDDWNWAKGMRYGRILAAFDRHKAAFLLGEILDPESGLPHLWHMGCCVMMLISADLRGVAVDDREASVHAYQEVTKLFQNMKDPAQTVKNGGGSVVEQNFRETYEEIRDFYENSDHGWEGLTMAEVVAEREATKKIWKAQEKFWDGAVMGKMAEFHPDAMKRAEQAQSQEADQWPYQDSGVEE